MSDFQSLPLELKVLIAKFCPQADPKLKIKMKYRIIYGLDCVGFLVEAIIYQLTVFGSSLEINLMHSGRDEITRGAINVSRYVEGTTPMNEYVRVKNVVDSEGKSFTFDDFVKTMLYNLFPRINERLKLQLPKHHVLNMVISETFAERELERNKFYKMRFIVDLVKNQAADSL